MNTSLEKLIEKSETIVGSSIGAVSIISGMTGMTTDRVIDIRDKAIKDLEKLILKAHAAGREEMYLNASKLLKDNGYSDEFGLLCMTDLLSKLEEMRKE